MHGDREQKEIDSDLANTLYAADPVAIVAHACALVLLSAVYLTRPADRRMILVSLFVYGIAVVTASGLRAWRRHRPFAFDVRGWIGLHALSNVLLHGAPGLPIWFAFQMESADAVAIHTVLLVALAALAYASNGLCAMNLGAAVVALMTPVIAVHLMQATPRDIAVSALLAAFSVALCAAAGQYRRRHRRIVAALADQQKLAETITRQKCLIEDASRAKTRFFAAASHDLRQPLHAIGLLAQALCERGARPEEREETAQNIIANVEALNHLFNQVLDLARIESGVTQVIPQHFSLSELLARIDKQFRPAAAAKGLAFRIAPSACVANTDPVLLERILINLVSNAVRYTERGAIWIGVRHGSDPARCHIEVRDSGIGIAPHEHELVFEEFYQVPLPQHAMRQGHGLGLSTVRRLLHLLGGELTLRSDLGRGTTVRVPVRLGEAGLITASLTAPPSVGALIEGRHILCVDDDPANLDALSTLLARWGCTVRGCRDELSAVRAIAEGFVPDAFLCDYQIGRHQTGIDAIGAVRETLRRRGHNQLACVMITGDMASPELSALAADGVPVLRKPVTPTRLRRTLDLLLQESGQDEAA
ncbi:MULTISPECIES: hybrid sensor histidine kinase/response regulator [unclassified Caballeronia]|uniref:ATP-binding response regulator n=1 Tax=unclassified Caballeronia TaxID=2646786 RepID=UPI00286053D7|nr:MULTISPECIES: hybrid sensor histidine kinase/response regulator [unclassified Caballeronia]MDR5740957.1 hybrid sensor histidine kinase/response regulator [Caballeronia sp. LZ016]MDR5806855.1 hybrid sensor histidine kinase/response regulator [Caballeronia sp. LZ019]